MLKFFNRICTVIATVFLASTVNAFESGTDYNSANMSYTADSTISQIIVFDSTMQSGGTLTFSVEAHAGGGRPLQHDTGQLKLEYYNGSTLLGSSETSYATGNLLQMNAWSSVPGDNSEAWTTLSLTSTDCGSAGSCSSVTHVRVIMIGTDTSWWAGNYGPQWRVPTVTYTPTGGTSGSNILYNPEFGLDPSGVFAQGWASSTSWGACGTTSGSVMCTTTAAGVTANMSGGGYDANGGTTAATPGGYTGTLSVTSFSGSSGGGSPTVVSTAPGTPVVTSSSSSGTTTTTVVDTVGATTIVETIADTRGAVTGKTLTVTRSITLVATTPVTRVTTDTTPVTTTTVTTPTTVTTYSDGSTTTTNGTPVTTTSTTDQVVTTTTTFNQVVTTGSSQDYTTRIDQFDILSEANARENLSLTSDPLMRHRAYDGEIKLRGANVNEHTAFTVQGSNANSNSQDGYSFKTERYSLGLAHRVRNDLLISGQFSQSKINLSGNDSTGSVNKNAVNLYALWSRNDWLVKTDLGYADNKFSTTHTLPALDLANSASTIGNDQWAAVRLYTPAMKGIRVFAGARQERNHRAATTDTGSALSAVDYAAVTTIQSSQEAGLRFDHYVNNNLSLYAEYSQNTQKLETAKAGLGYQAGAHTVIQLGAVQQRQNGWRNDGVMLELKILF